MLILGKIAKIHGKLVENQWFNSGSGSIVVNSGYVVDDTGILMDIPSGKRTNKKL